MPHLKVAPFETGRLDELSREEGPLMHRDTGVESTGRELLEIVWEGEWFVLELRKRQREYLIRPDKITRPLDTGRIKEALAWLAQAAELEVLHSNIEHSPRAPRPASRYERSIEAFESAEFPFERVALEVGFGSGRHLLHQAERHPDRLHIGLEIHTPSAQQVLKQIALRGLENVWVVNYDARLLLEMLPSNLAEAIWVHFPVPWDKKPHRRVIGRGFVAESLRVLEPGGVLELRTDSDNYYRYALEVFGALPKVRFDVEKNRDLEVVSKYEARWRRQEKDIYTLRLHCEESSGPRRLEGSFAFEGRTDLTRIETLPSSPVVGEEYFVHFGRRYRRSDGSGGLVECSFGSFERPEHKYLEYDGEGRVAYRPDRPVRTAVNLKAHRTIGEYLYG